MTNHRHHRHSPYLATNSLMNKSTGIHWCETELLEDLFQLMEEFRDIQPDDLINMEDISAMKWDEITVDADVVTKTKRRRRHKPMYRNADGDTMLHLLIINENSNVDRYITENADIREINAVNNLGQTPLHMAIFVGLMSTIKAIIEKRFVDLERFDHNLNTPLHLACMKSPGEALEIVEVLLKNYSSSISIINAKNDEGLTPLHIASQQNHLELIKLLILKGAQVNIQDEKTGKTSLMFLAEVDEEGKTLSHLIEYFDADVSITSYCDSNALHFACGKDNVNAVKALLENGAEVGLKNIQRKTEKDLTSDQEIKRMLESQMRKRRRSSRQHNHPDEFEGNINEEESILCESNDN